ncbi:ECF family DNA-directed RNA polymerase sigma subunit SigV [Sporosarcina newyorkensis 2681]|uniref:ECF family DNA-directed RNA polymerase sigma subunit SigV n=2 Tax=Caryophanaceae TaxID=186818 RepID=F9DSF9_9BACL|nr:ECF family DNA-directed RNA polymerase sigma subunit SigV [Sporosarcina newyorkensis 2681]
MLKTEEGGSFVMTKKEKFELVENFIVENREAHYRLAYSYVRNKENALDIVQESIFKALKSIDRLEEITYLKTWFYRILVNTSIDFIRKHQRMTVMDDDILSMHLPQAEDEIIDMDLHDAIDQLAPYDKTLIILRFFEDLKIDEIATVMNDNINTIKSRLYRILNKLRIKVGEDFKV